LFGGEFFIVGGVQLAGLHLLQLRAVIWLCFGLRVGVRI
jgi:hypothetical protein